MTDVKFAGDAKPVQRELETYEKPTLVELGSILELTEGLGMKDDDGCYEGHNNF